MQNTIKSKKSAPVGVDDDDDDDEEDDDEEDEEDDEEEDEGNNDVGRGESRKCLTVEIAIFAASRFENPKIPVEMQQNATERMLFWTHLCKQD